MDNNLDNTSLENNIEEFNSMYGEQPKDNTSYENYINNSVSQNNQPIYSQPMPTNQYANIPPTKHKPNKNEPETPEEHKKGNFFSGLSLACTLGGKLLTFLCAGVANVFGTVSTVDYADNPVIQGFGALLYGILGLAELAGFILMIYVRVKYPKNTFGKVLMWLYIIGFILYLIAAIVLIVACISCAKSCPS